MKILNQSDNLSSFLKTLHRKKITVISAFAGGTEDIVNALLKNHNKLELIIGTINSFSSPDFFGHCLAVESSALSLYVDFGYQNSTHWKLYLVEPDTVIIGSANFTVTGLSLSRDTCVMVNDKTLFGNYKKEIESLKSSKDVTGFHEAAFIKKLAAYRVSHRRMQAALARVSQFNDCTDWLDNDANQLIPIFIWNSMHSKSTIDEAYDLLASDDSEVTKSGVRDFFTYGCGKNELPYSQEDVVLCARSTGSHIDFYSFDRIIHKDGINYIYSYRRERYPRPFKLSNKIKNQIKARIADWDKNGVIEIGRSEIESLVKDAN